MGLPPIALTINIMNNQILSNIESVLLKHKTIGLLVSGGFDSTLLSYLVHETRDRLKTGNVFEFFTVPRHDDSVIHAKRIIDFIDNKFNQTSTAWHIVGDPDLHFTQQVSSGIAEAISHYNFEILLTGDNIVPPEDEVPGGPPRKRGNHPKLYKPFFDYTKDVMLQLAIDKGLTDIMEITHTCTESKTLRCNLCWQCRERAWAFRKCGYIDPGTM
jgi:hypothetical protein